MKKISVLLTLAALLCAGCPILIASTGNYGGSNFGTVALSTGFLPDPHVAAGRSGGQRPAESLIAAGCRGYITSQPDHIFVAQTGFSFLRIMVSSPGDTTLIVQAPNGQVLCDDDGGSGLNPMVQGSFGPGTYYVWVGSYSEGQYHDYRLGFTELSHVTDYDL